MRSTGMGDDEKRKAFLKGFEEGLRAAWREIGSLTTRGYSSTELGVLAKSKLAVLHRDVEAMESRLIEADVIPVVGGGELVARKDLGRRGAYIVREPVAEPGALVDIASAISDFAEDGGNAAVLLEGLEYMISQNGFASIMRFLQKVNEKIVLNDSYLLISANPAAMKEQEYRLLAKEVAGEI